jgi:galacturan 1,4-alpha-galacturonidase
MTKFIQIFTFVFAFVTLIEARGTLIKREVDRISHKRAVCTSASARDAGTDDVPAIEAAIASCGNRGKIVIPAGKRTP